MTEALSVQLTDADSDPERLDELTSRLRAELLNLDVESVEKASGGQAPDGSRAFEVEAIGALLVTLQASAPAITGVINTIRDWLKRNPDPTGEVEITMGDRTIKLSAASSANRTSWSPSSSGRAPPRRPRPAPGATPAGGGT